MSIRTQPWFVRSVRPISYLLVLAIGMWLGHAYWGKLVNGSVLLADKEIVRVDTHSETTKVLNLADSEWLDVEVEELTGKNIEFSVMQDGHTIHSSGVHAHVAKGRVRALPGLCAIKVLNDNLFDGKEVAMTIRASPLE